MAIHQEDLRGSDIPTKKRKETSNGSEVAEHRSSTPGVLKRIRVSTSPPCPPSNSFILADLGICQQDINNRFAVSEAVLGSGQYGTVRECTDIGTGDRLACKTIRKDNAEEETQAEDLRSEVEIMSRLQGCDGLVQLRGAFEDSDSVHLVMDLCEGGELYDEIVQRERFTEQDAAHIMAELARGVAFCHARGVIHRDLKPENILLSRKLNPTHSVATQIRQSPEPLFKLADFGLATRVAPGELTSGVAGSPFYMAPEVLTGKYGTKADVWSLGVILYILLCGSPPFQGATDEETFEAILCDSPDMTSPVWRGVSLEAKSLVRRLLVKDPSQRPPAHKILTHPWVVHHVSVAPDVASTRGRLSAVRYSRPMPAS